MKLRIYSISLYLAHRYNNLVSSSRLTSDNLRRIDFSIEMSLGEFLFDERLRGVCPATPLRISAWLWAPATPPLETADILLLRKKIVHRFKGANAALRIEVRAWRLKLFHPIILYTSQTYNHRFISLLLINIAINSWNNISKQCKENFLVLVSS